VCHRLRGHNRARPQHPTAQQDFPDRAGSGLRRWNATIVVTGGGNGIGRELVLNRLARGARAAAVDINKTALQASP